VTVEHWDNIQEREGPNESGHTMVDGVTQAEDRDRTETNREHIRSFVDEVLVNGRLAALDRYVDPKYTEHNPRMSDGLPALKSALSASASGAGISIVYDRIHRLLAEGNFVICVSEGALDGVHASFYDLFRVEDGKVAEHWDTTEAIPLRSEWKNENGKF